MSSARRKERAAGLEAYDFDLPAERIAQRPLPERTASRLLVLDGARGEIRDMGFRDLGTLLDPGDVLVFNDTRVIPARLTGRKASGGRVEFLVEKTVDARTVLALAGSSKPLRTGSRVWIEKGDRRTGVSVLDRVGDYFTVRFDDQPASRILDEFGHVPLPPYIRRGVEDMDRDRYQTVFARSPGAVAAPTAGLHFDAILVESLRARGVQCVFLTLHVGSGTFRPIHSEDVASHRLHPERLRVPHPVVEAVAGARAKGNKVVAVGTTCVRALEAWAQCGEPGQFEGETDLFIQPGHRFQVVDAMITNFHLPRSSLLMLVCAFAGRSHVLGAYAHALQAGYRFYSYGDAMYLTPNPAGGPC